MLARKAVLTGPWDLLFIVTPDGKIAAASEAGISGPLPENAVDARALFARALQGETGQSDLIRGVLTGKPTVIFAAPVRDESRPDQPILGAIVGYFAWPVVLQILDDVSNETEVVLFNRAAQVIGTRTRD